MQLTILWNPKEARKKFKSLSQFKDVCRNQYGNYYEGVSDDTIAKEFAYLMGGAKPKKKARKAPAKKAEKKQN